MRQLGKAILDPRSGGEPMPSVFPSLSAVGADARRGELMMIVAQPAAGKSVISLWMALTWVRRDGLRGLMFSADATAKAVAQRAASMTLGEYLPFGDDRIVETVQGLYGLEWSFDSEITWESMEHNIDAFVEKWGCEPDFVVVDNLTDVFTRDGDEFGTLRAMMRDLNVKVRETSTAGIVLHHVSEDAKEEPCPPRKAIHGKVSVKPTIVLATARPETGVTKPIAVLKNRYGAEDRTGKTAFWIPFDPITLQFGGLQ